MEKPQAKVAVKEESEAAIFKTVLFYSLCILVIPLVTFFASKIVFFDAIFGLNTVGSYVGAAVTAVITLHIVLGLYLYRTFVPATKAGKQD